MFLHLLAIFCLVADEHLCHYCHLCSKGVISLCNVSKFVESIGAKMYVEHHKITNFYL